MWPCLKWVRNDSTWSRDRSPADFRKAPKVWVFVWLVSDCPINKSCRGFQQSFSSFSLTAVPSFSQSCRESWSLLAQLLRNSERGNHMCSEATANLFGKLICVFTAPLTWLKHAQKMPCLQHLSICSILQDPVQAPCALQRLGFLAVASTVIDSTSQWPMCHSWLTQLAGLGSRWAWRYRRSRNPKAPKAGQFRLAFWPCVFRFFRSFYTHCFWIHRSKW